MKTIIFIEDEAALQRSLGETLRKEGYAVINALDGEIGLKLAKEKKADLILLDLILPKLDGFEVLKELKINPETSNIPVIILTNLERTEDVDKALALGAKTYLVKANYNLAEVIEKVNQALAN